MNTKENALMDDIVRLSKIAAQFQRERDALRQQNAELREALEHCVEGLRNIGKRLIKRDCFNWNAPVDDPCPCSLHRARAALDHHLKGDQSERTNAL